MTIEEMIQDMGQEFRMLILHTTYRKKKLEKPFEAVPNKRLRPEAKSQKGKTAHEAIENLLIHLKNL